MLHALLKRLNGHALDPGELDAALAQLGRDREAASATRAELEERRKRALLDDESGATIRKLDAEIELVNIALEKLGVAEQPLRERLAAAQAAARRRRWKEIRSAGLEAAAAFSAAARAAAAAHEKYIQVRETATREGFTQEASTLPPTPNINGAALLAADLLDLFDRACSTPASENVQPIKVAAKAPRRAPAPADAMSPHGVRLAPGAPIAKAERAADDLGELGAGEARVRVIRAGFSPSDHLPAAARGQLVRMPGAAARVAAAAGAVELIEERAP